jgi:putative acetyltransferase
MNIRRYRIEDTRELMTLFYRTVREVNIRDYTQEQVEVWAPDDMDQDRWEQTLSARCTFVAEQEGRLAGFGELEPMEEGGLINRFYVSADHQGQGVGSALLSAIEAEAQQRGLTRLFTEASITARPFFERRGFVTLEKQAVVRQNVTLHNFRMEKILPDED